MELNYQEQKLLQDIIETYICNKRRKDYELDEDNKFYAIAHSQNVKKLQESEKLLEKLWDYMTSH